MSEKPSCGCCALAAVSTGRIANSAVLDASACLYPAAAARIAELEAEAREHGAVYDRLANAVDSIPAGLMLAGGPPYTLTFTEAAIRAIWESQQHRPGVLESLEAKAAKYDAGVKAIQQKQYSLVGFGTTMAERGLYKQALQFALRALGAEPQEEP